MSKTKILKIKLVLRLLEFLCRNMKEHNLNASIHNIPVGAVPTEWIRGVRQYEDGSGSYQYYKSDKSGFHVIAYL